MDFGLIVFALGHAEDYAHDVIDSILYDYFHQQNCRDASRKNIRDLKRLIEKEADIVRKGHRV